MNATYHEKDLEYDRGIYKAPDGRYLIDAFGRYCLIEEAGYAHKVRMQRRYAIVASFIFAIIGVGLQLGYGHSLLHSKGDLILPMFLAFVFYLAAFLTFLAFNLWLRKKLPKANIEKAAWRDSFVIEARKGTVQEWLVLSIWSLLFVVFLLVTTSDVISSSIFALIGAYSGMSAFIHYRNP